MNKPLQVGVTGGIGSGKSLVCKVFSALGVPVYDADSRAKAIMTTPHIGALPYGAEIPLFFWRTYYLLP